MNTFSRCLLIALLCTLFTAGNSYAQTADADPVPSKEGLLQAYQDENWDRVQAFASELLKNDENNADFHNLLGIALVKKNNLEEAEKHFEFVKTSKPDDINVYSNLCAVQISLKRDAAVDSCLEATKRITDNPELFYLTGQVLEGHKRENDAIEMYENAAKLNPNDLRFVTAVTSIEFKRGNNERAYDLTVNAIENGEISHAVLYLNAILGANRIGKYDKAVAWADEGYGKYKDPAMLIGKAEALNAMKSYDEAGKLWQELLSTYKDNEAVKARVSYGYAKYLLANACSSEKYQTCSTPSPDSCCERERLALELLDSIKDKTGKYLKKEKDFTVYLGLAQTLNRKFEDAEATLTTAINENIAQDNAGAMAALSIALYQFDDERDHEAGRRYYNQAVEASPDFTDIKRVLETRAWPPRLVDSLKNIQDDIAAQNAPKKKSGCGCDLTQPGSLSLSAFFAFILALMGLSSLKRNRRRA